jgi:tetratricopeptide (TPR) repeat protein
MTAIPFHTVTALLLFGLLPFLTATGSRAAWTEREEEPVCEAGQLWDARNSVCIAAEGANLPDGNLLDYARALADAGRYQEALGVLDLLKAPETAKALNIRGFATRKLGRTAEGIAHYLKAVALDPDFPEARGYLGEAYVTTGRFDLAREQLAQIERICGRFCPEYVELAGEIGKAQAR